MDNDQNAVNHRQYLTFFLADEEFAVGVLRVKEIIEYGVVTTVPGTPAHVRGVINLRGSVVPVVDLSVKFGRPESPIGRRTCIVIVETEAFGDRTTTGVVADAVNQVIELAPDAIEAPPAFGTGIQLDYLAGIAKTDARFVLVLNVDTVLSAEARASVAVARPVEAPVPVPVPVLS